MLKETSLKILDNQNFLADREQLERMANKEKEDLK